MTSTPLAGRVVIVTGGGRGLGRAYCCFLASHGASVVVNDLGAPVGERGSDASVSRTVVDAIVADGDAAVASSHDVSDWEAARDLVALAVEEFGRLDVLVNNAGNARPTLLAGMTEGDWDAVVDVHLKGHAATSAAAMAYWNDRADAGARCDASIIHTSSVAGMTGVPGTGSYSAAKAGIIGLSKAIAAEGAAFGVRSNVVSPVAHTRLTSGTHPVPPSNGREWMPGDAANVAPLVGWLARADCPANDQVFHVVGRQVVVLRVPSVAGVATCDHGRWTLDDLDETLPALHVSPLRREAMLTEIEPLEA